MRRYTAAMQITIDVPDDLAVQLAFVDSDPARLALETIAVEAYRTHKLSSAQVRRLLGFQTRLQVHELLKRHSVPLHYDLTEFEHDKDAFGALSNSKA